MASIIDAFTLIWEFDARVAGGGSALMLASNRTMCIRGASACCALDCLTLSLSRRTRASIVSLVRIYLRVIEATRLIDLLALCAVITQTLMRPMCVEALLTRAVLTVICGRCFVSI